MAQALASLTRRWEFVLFVLIAFALIAGSQLSPFFLTADNLLSQTRDLMVVGFLALGLTPVVVMGEIDLSGEANLAVCAVVLGLLFEQHVNIWLASVLAVGLGAFIGALNGVLIVSLRLPSLIGTLATLISLRGLAFVLVEESPIAGFPGDFVALGNQTIEGTLIPQSLVAFLIVALPIWFLLSSTVLGRWVYAIGANANAAKLSGIPYERVRLALFTFSGALAGCAAVILAAHYDSVRADAAQGAVLSVLTVVLLGGVSIFGGVGSLGAVLLSLALIGLIQNGMRLANIAAEPQALVIGALLILSVVIPRLLYSVRDRRRGKHAFVT
jgi:rhamnose transport system permease protein